MKQNWNNMDVQMKSFDTIKDKMRSLYKLTGVKTAVIQLGANKRFRSCKSSYSGQNQWIENGCNYIHIPLFYFFSEK